MSQEVHLKWIALLRGPISLKSLMQSSSQFSASGILIQDVPIPRLCLSISLHTLFRQLDPTQVPTSLRPAIDRSTLLIDNAIVELPLLPDQQREALVLAR